MEWQEKVGKLQGDGRRGEGDCGRGCNRGGWGGESEAEGHGQSINQSKTLFNFKFLDSKIANISEENKSIK